MNLNSVPRKVVQLALAEACGELAAASGQNVEAVVQELVTKAQMGLIDQDKIPGWDQNREPDLLTGSRTPSEGNG